MKLVPIHGREDVYIQLLRFRWALQSEVFSLFFSLNSPWMTNETLVHDLHPSSKQPKWWMYCNLHLRWEVERADPDHVNVRSIRNASPKIWPIQLSWCPIEQEDFELFTFIIIQFFHLLPLTKMAKDDKGCRFFFIMIYIKTTLPRKGGSFFPITLGQTYDLSVQYWEEFVLSWISIFTGEKKLAFLFHLGKIKIH